MVGARWRRSRGDSCFGGDFGDDAATLARAAAMTARRRRKRRAAARRRRVGMSVPDLVSDGPVLVSDWMNGCLDVPIGRCESA